MNINLKCQGGFVKIYNDKKIFESEWMTVIWRKKCSKKGAKYMERFYLAVKRIFIVLLVFQMIYGNNFIVRAQDIEKSVWNKAAEIEVEKVHSSVEFLPVR